MRVIAGTCRGRTLAEFKGCDVRPTPDRVREALFSILQSKIGPFTGLAVLDLFAGSGALGIEAISRGAETAWLVDKDATAAAMIVENLQRCQISAKARVFNQDAFVTLETFPEQTFDLIFVDPPYRTGLAETALHRLAETGRLTVHGYLCIETAATEDLPETCRSLQRIDQRRYGSVMIHFYTHSARD